MASTDATPLATMKDGMRYTHTDAIRSHRPLPSSSDRSVPITTATTAHVT